eukprot:TRINITY_DN54882_c0_g1_i1.p1 TRINITY_DN54882_c0_g1~~TRINITY_DN54882_c0_g1_i1.p1  ORF type:complete len:1012 (-),score=151.69 TRINITY_DN54882_c0_g1_i1:161-3196(-)
MVRSRRYALATALAAAAPAAVSGSFCHLFYVNADTNLESAQLGDMNEILKIKNDPTFTGLLYMDRNNAQTSTSSAPMEHLLDESGHETRNEIPTTIWAKMEPGNGGYWQPSYNWRIQKRFNKELDTTSVPTVEEFATWAASQCSPGQRKIFSFNMHGGGVSGISGDDSNGHSGLSIPELAKIFRNLHNKGIDFEMIGFDTCLMSAYSNAQALMPYTDWLLASLPTEPGYGWDYTKVNTRAPDVESYGKAIVDGFLAQRAGPNELVLTNLKKFSKVVSPMQSLMDTLSNGLRSGDERLLNAMERARADSANYHAVWETFKAWFHIEGVAGEELSQMDLGSFLEKLGVQCKALQPRTAAVVELIDQAVDYRHNGPYAACTGSGCEKGTHGIALWYKKRRWMLGAYEYYESKGYSRYRVDPLLDQRLEKEIKEGLPHWYNVLKELYLFQPKSMSASKSVCSTGSSASYCPSDGRTCTKDGACQCGPSMTKQTANHGQCYVCAQPPANQCPAGGNTCSPDRSCQCDSRMEKAAFRARNAYGQITICYACVPKSGSRSELPLEPAGLNDDIEAMEGQKVMMKGAMTNESYDTISASAPAEPAPLANPVPPTPPVCSDEEPLCSVIPSKATGASDLIIKGKFAEFVTSLYMVIGAINPRAYDPKSGRRLANEKDAIFFMQVPSRFDSDTTFETRWPSYIPYMVSTDDECPAFVRIMDSEFASPSACDDGFHITLTVPVHYFNTSAALAANEFERAELRQVVECETFKAQGEMSLRVANTKAENVPHVIKKSAGGYVQPLLKTHSTTLPGRVLETKPCPSKAPFDWSEPLVLEMTKLHDNKQRGTVDKFIAQLLSNKKAKGTSVQEQASSMLRDPFSTTFVVDPKSGLLDSSSGFESQNLSGDPEGGKFPTWGYVAIPLALLAVAAGAYVMLRPSEAPKTSRTVKKSRGLKLSDPSPPVAAQPAAITAPVATFTAPTPMYQHVAAPVYVQHAPMASYVQQAPRAPVAYMAAPTTLVTH